MAVSQVNSFTDIEIKDLKIKYKLLKSVFCKDAFSLTENTLGLNYV